MSKPFLVVKQSGRGTVTVDPRDYSRLEIVAQNTNGDILSDFIMEFDEDIVIHVVAHAQNSDQPAQGA